MPGRIKLCSVEFTFVLEGRGLVILPGIPYPSDKMRSVRVGEAIVLIKPDGSEIRTNIGSIESIYRNPPADHAPFLATASLTKEDVPLGTEVWLCD
jgi:hypothetical protein